MHHASHHRVALGQIRQMTYGVRRNVGGVQRSRRGSQGSAADTTSCGPKGKAGRSSSESGKAA
jgi:hypothetical protein